MNYEEMSDFEINVEVAKASGLDVQYQSMRNDGRVLVVVKIDCGVEHYYRVPDYCNNWADAGPVIINNCIALTPCMGKNNGDATGYFAHKNPTEIEFDENSKALRAAMIVFLMMKDAEK